MLSAKVALLLAAVHSVSGFLPMTAMQPSLVPISGKTTPTFSCRVDAGVMRTKMAAEIEAATDITLKTRKALARKWFQEGDGFYQPCKNEDMLADDFVFKGPVIGPLNKVDLAHTQKVFKVYDAFPDLTVETSEFTQDPRNPNRFWGIVRVEGTHTEDLCLAAYTKSATGKKLDIGPELVSVIFNDEDKIVLVTAGYVGDMHEGHKAGGLGLAFGVLKSIGEPAPRPGGKLFRFANWIGSRVKNYPKGRSHVDDLPEAWKHMGRTYGLRTSDAWD